MKGEQAKITGVILAGGKARRMGGNDKGLMVLNGRPLVSYVIDALKPYVDDILINANRSLEQYQAFGFPVVGDETTSFDGPLAGVLAAMKRAETGYLLTAPCDTPMLLGRMVERLINAMRTQQPEVCVAHDGNRLQPVFMNVNCELSKSLENYLGSGNRKIDVWLNRHRFEVVDCSDYPEMFVNVNSPADLADIEQALMAENPPGHDR